MLAADLCRWSLLGHEDLFPPHRLNARYSLS